jgi:hypothetical protein
MLEAMIGSGQDPAGANNFKSAGFPTIALLGGVTIMIWGAYRGHSSGGANDTRATASRVFLVIQSLLVFTAIFLTFGPGTVLGQGVPSNVLGLLFFFLVGLGYNAHFTDSNTSWLGWWVFAFIQTLALLGLLPSLGFPSAIWNVTGELCMQYFGEDLDRCNNKGFLQLIRVWGLFSVFLLVIALVQTFHKVQWTLKPIDKPHPNMGSDYVPPVAHPAASSSLPSQPIGGPGHVAAGHEGLLNQSFQSDGAVHTGAGTRTVDGYSAI